MNDQLTTQQLREHLTAHLDAATPPPGDLDAVRRRSRAATLRRIAGPALLTAAAVGVGALVLMQDGTVPAPPDDRRDADLVVAAEGPLDLDGGLRAYAAPDQRIYLAGTSVELTPDMTYLDTDAAATPYGMVFTDPDGQLQLLGEDGTSHPIGKPSEVSGAWHPTVKVDAARPYIAYARKTGPEDVTVTVLDLATEKPVASTDLTCSGGCDDLVIDGIDSGLVFIRTSTGTGVWDYEGLESYRFAGPKTRVADVRNGVVLFEGPRPTQEIEGLRYVAGAIDAQLSHDGRYVLYWSDQLTTTATGGTDVIKLDLPVDATFFSFDTDGSVLAATAGSPSRVFDCEIPDGPCEELEEMNPQHGDPMFIGNDM